MGLKRVQQLGRLDLMRFIDPTEGRYMEQFFPTMNVEVGLVIIIAR